MVEVEVGIPVRNGSGVVHDTFHAFMLSELDRYGKTTPDLFDKSVSGWRTTSAVAAA
jgi:hypothetical protein